MAAASSNLRLKDFFPKVTKECRPVATPFFECFGIKSKQPEEGSSSVIHEALAYCKTQMEAYDKCMAASLAKKQKAALYRVPDAYRTRGTAEGNDDD